jgi:hypothetical protein
MTSLSEQLSTVRTSQWEAQLDIFNALGSRALSNAEQLIALNLKTSRASVESAAGAFRQLLDARAPGDLLAVGASVQRQWQQLFSYNSALLGIATGARPQAWTLHPAGTLAAPFVDIPTAPAQVLEQVAIASAEATTVASEIAAAAADTGDALARSGLQAAGAEVDADIEAAAPPQAPQPDAAPVPEVTELDAEKANAAPSETPQEDQPAADARAVATPTADALPAQDPVERAIADDAPTAKAKPLVEALNHIAPKPAGAAHPLASTLPLQANGHVDLPIVTPVENAPPLQMAVREGRPARASRKK